MVGYADDELSGLELGSSLRPIFERNLAPYGDVVTVHEGDVLDQTWSGEPIEILFIDVCKSWEINAHVVHEFFPVLIPGTSVIVQQDLVHWLYPWCAIVMEHLSESFEYLGWTPYASSVWRCVGVPAPRALAIDWKRDIGLESGLELLRHAADRHTGWAVPYLEVAEATLMHEFGDDQAAQAQLDRVELQYGTSVPYLAQAYRDVRSLVTGVVVAAEGDAGESVG